MESLDNLVVVQKKRIGRPPGKGKKSEAKSIPLKTDGRKAAQKARLMASWYENVKNMPATGKQTKRSRTNSNLTDTSSFASYSPPSHNSPPWNDFCWLEELDVVFNENESVHLQLTRLLRESTNRLAAIRCYFRNSANINKSDAEKQVELLMRSFREMVHTEENADHSSVRTEYCRSYLPPAFENLECSARSIIGSAVEANTVSFALFEVLFIHSCLCPEALGRRPALVRFYQNFRQWLCDQSSSQSFQF